MSPVFCENPNMSATALPPAETIRSLRDQPVVAREPKVMREPVGL
jgi:hypothetical protein